MQDYEAELQKNLEEFENTQYECSRIESQLDNLEEDILWQNRISKELDDDIFDSYPQDKKLQRIVIEKEEKLKQKNILEGIMFQECRDKIWETRKQAAEKQDDFREELRKMRAENVSEGGQVEDYNNTYED